MKALFCAIPMLVLCLCGRLQAAEPTNELNENLAIRLISEILDILPNGINVATVIDGRKPTEDGFVESHVRRVTAVHPVLLEGRMVRRIRCYDFSWSPKYGWFYQESGSSRSGEEVRIWSETAGEVIVK